MTEGDRDISRSGQLVDVTIFVPAVFGCRRAEVAGDFTEWCPVVMRRERDGYVLVRRAPRTRSTLALPVPTGRRRVDQ